MEYSSRYRTFIASFLLVVYAFIAMPASALHSHDQLSGSYSEIDSGSKNILVKEIKSSCELCNHVYTPYLTADSLPDLTTTKLFQRYADRFFLVVISNSIRLADTRGPPSI